MEHKTFGELTVLLNDAKRKVEVGAKYLHYKNNEKVYLVTGLSILEDNDQVAVKYAPESDPGVEFIRPLSSWLEIVEQDGKAVPRFSKI